MNPLRYRQVREAARLALMGVVLIAVGLLTHPGGHQDESLWAVARQSTWAKLGDWPAAEASLVLMLLSCGVIFLTLSLNQLWHLWLGPRYLHWVLLVIRAAPFVTLLAGLYYLAKALF